jgi:transcriptional regulator with XRE-family HTH domain
MIGQYIRKQRLARGIQLRDMCRKLGIDASNYSKFERGKIRSIESLEKVVEYIFELESAKDYKLWYTAIAASRQSPNWVYESLVLDCLSELNERETQRINLLANQWVARSSPMIQFCNTYRKIEPTNKES